MSNLRQDERGFSLMELMMAMAIGGIVLTMVMQIFVTGLTRSAQVGDRVEAAARARLAVDRAVTLLGAQTCVDGNAPIVDGQSTSVTFRANLGIVDADPKQYRLRYDDPTDTLYEEQFDPTKVSGLVTYGATPSRSRVLATDVAPVGGKIFSYYKFQTTGAAAGQVDPAPLLTTLNDSDRQQVVRVGVDLTAIPTRTKQADKRSTEINAQAVVVSSDPSNPNKGPNC
jgi:prepilin-type N-terminal cleavage/methylation domain-containing protein